MSKVVTAAVVMQLVESGALTLDDAVGARLAAFVGTEMGDPAIAAITVRHLLSHTSGFGTYRSTFFGGDAGSCADAARIGMTHGLEQPPGHTYHYSNMNYCLLGLLVEDVVGQPYETVAQDRLLGPLGIEDMRMVGTFDPDPSEVEHPSTSGRVYMEALGAAGSWVATATDVVTIADSLEGSRPGWHPLSADSMAMMRVPAPTVTPPAPGRDRWYGLGEIVFADGSWGHTGTVENTHAMFLVRPDGVTWALLISGDHPGESDDIARVFDAALAEAGIVLSG
ncbi:MAG: serine hydrolase domain-containing protein [Desertimonas sp.]